MLASRSAWVGFVAAAVMGSALGVALTLVISGSTGRAFSSSVTPSDLRRRLQRLESVAAALDGRLESLAGTARSEFVDRSGGSSTKASPSPPLNDVAERLDLLETRMTLLQQTLDDQLARNAIAIAGVQRRLDGTAVLDDAGRERIRHEIEEENRLAFERRLGELRAANQDARSKWIADVSDELGLTIAQRDGIVRIYEVQTTRWAEVFERIQREALSPGESAEAFRSLRRETDEKLREFLSGQQLERFRDLEVRRFTTSVPR